jgi:hypothetical protein
MTTQGFAKLLWLTFARGLGLQPSHVVIRGLCPYTTKDGWVQSPALKNHTSNVPERRNRVDIGRTGEHLFRARNNGN